MLFARRAGVGNSRIGSPSQQVVQLNLEDNYPGIIPREPILWPGFTGSNCSMPLPSRVGYDPLKGESVAIGAVFGLGATMAAVAAPSHFPNTQPWVWHWLFWGGVAFMTLMASDADAQIAGG